MGARISFNGKTEESIDRGQHKHGAHQTLVCKHCSLEDPSKKLYGHICEHVTSKRHIKQKDNALSKEAQKKKQLSTDGILIC